MGKINPEKRRYYLYGAGGHAKVILEIAELNKIIISGLIDEDNKETLLKKYPILNPNYYTHLKGDTMLIAIGDNGIRRKIAEAFKTHFFSIAHPTADISPYSFIGEGTVIMRSAIINTDTQIGKHCIINSSAVVEHDCKISDYVHIAPNATICGGVSIGTGSFIGAGSVVNPNLKIGDFVYIGSGAVVVKSIENNSKVVGNPAKNLKRN